MNQQKLIDEKKIRLSVGAHRGPEEGVCIMEMISYLTKSPIFNDYPACVCPVIATFCQEINDGMLPSQRNLLTKRVTKMIGTTSPGHERERLRYLATSVVRVCVANNMEAAGHPRLARPLRKVQSWEEARAELQALPKKISTGTSTLISRMEHIFESDPAEFPEDCLISAAREVGRIAGDIVDIVGSCPDIKAARYKYWESVLGILDGVLTIGPSGGTFDPNRLDKLAALIELVPSTEPARQTEGE